MKFGVYGPADVSSIQRSVRAEQLGYEWAAFSDSPMAFSDAFVTMALTVQATKKLTVGTSVAAAGIRMPAVAAAGLASINQIAPGRVFAGFGTGMTSYALMGEKSPIKQADLRDYVNVVRALLAGEETELVLNGRARPIRFQNLDHDFVNTADPIPIYLAAHGPKGQVLAGEIADGVVDGWGDFPDIDGLKDRLNAGADRVGKTGKDFAIFNPRTFILIDSDQDLTSNRVVEEAGSLACIRLHQMYARFGETRGHDMPPYVAPIWDEYVQLMRSWPDATTFHYRSFAGHQTFIHPDERRFITPELIRATHLVARPEELIDTLREWESAGVTHVSISGTAACIDAKVERFAKDVLSKL